MLLGISGVRSLTEQEAKAVKKELVNLARKGGVWHVGDAAGVDAIARDLAPRLVLHEAASREPWCLQRRSKELVDALASAEGTLHAWVNKPCPDGLTVDSWKGSGTWGTVRYAHSKGVKVQLHWLTEPHMPEWMRHEQLSLW